MPRGMQCGDGDWIEAAARLRAGVAGGKTFNPFGISPGAPILFNDVLTTQSSRQEARDADDETSVDGRVGAACGRMAA